MTSAETQILPTQEAASSAAPARAVGQDPVQVFIVAVILVAIVCTAFNSMPRHKFVVLDDGMYLGTNRALDGGLTWKNVKWAFSEAHLVNYHPVTWLSFLADVSLYGMNPYPAMTWPGGFKITNLALHAANTVLFYLILLRLTNLNWASALVAILFGVHPLHVESVAWATERKDVLSTFFVLLAIGAYVRYAARGSYLAYGAMLVLYALSLLSKQMYVTLPGVLLLLDYWPLRRIGWPRGVAAGNGGGELALSFPAATWTRAIVEKLPLAAMAAVMAVVIYMIQAANPAVLDLRPPWSMRLPNALHNYGVYAAQTFWPMNLTFFYPYPEEPFGWKELAWPAAFLAVVSLAAALLRRRAPYLLVGWLWYLGTLVPVVGIVQVGWQAHADRYTYFPIVGIFIAVVFGLEEAVRRFPAANWPVKAVQSAVIAACVYLTIKQTAVWQSGVAFCEHGLKVDDRNFMAYLQMGTLEGQLSEWDKSVENLRRSRDLQPKYLNGRLNLAVAETTLGNVDEALAEFEAVREIIPKADEAHFQIGLIHLGRDNPDEAAERFEEVLRLKPERVQARFLLGLARVKQKDFEAARREFEAARDSKESEGTSVRTDAQAMLELLDGVASADPEAVERYRRRFDYPPTYSGSLLMYRSAYQRYQRALQAQRLRMAEAAKQEMERSKEEFARSTQLWPGNADAWYNLGVMYANEHRDADAIACFQNALDANPDHETSRKGMDMLAERVVGRMHEGDYHLRILDENPDVSPFHGTDFRFDPTGDPNLFQGKE